MLVVLMTVFDECYYVVNDTEKNDGGNFEMDHAAGWMGRMIMHAPVVVVVVGGRWREQKWEWRSFAP